MRNVDLEIVCTSLSPYLRFRCSPTLSQIGFADFLAESLWLSVSIGEAKRQRRSRIS